MTERNIDLSLGALLKDAIRTELAKMHLGLPARVTSYDPSSQSASVQPLLKEAYLNDDGEEEVTDLPEIHSVPVSFPSGGGWRIAFPLAAGDIVYLSFSERSLDRWQIGESGQCVDPAEARVTDLSDAVVVAYIRPNTAPQQNLPTDSLVLGREDGSVQITLNGDSVSIDGASIELNAGGTADAAFVRGEDLQAFLNDLLVWLSLHTHPTAPTGPISPPSPTPVIPQFSPTTLSGALRGR